MAVPQTAVLLLHQCLHMWSLVCFVSTHQAVRVSHVLKNTQEISAFIVSFFVKKARSSLYTAYCVSHILRSVGILVGIFHMHRFMRVALFHSLLGKYLLIYISTIFLGNIGAFSSFWLALRGFLGHWGVLIAIFIVLFAELTSDLFWYGVGRLFSRTRFAGYLQKRFAILQAAEGYVATRGRRTIFVAKFLYGASYPVMFSAGWWKLDFRYFFVSSLLASVFWLPVIFFLSYTLTSSLSSVAAVHTFRQIEGLFVVGVILFVGLQFLFSRLAKRLMNGK